MSDFLDYIAESMIVADKSKRDRSQIVKKRLQKLLQECETTSDYAVKPNPAPCVPVSGSSDAGAFSDPHIMKVLANQNKKETMMARFKRWMYPWDILSLGMIQISQFLRSWTGV